MTTKRKGAPIGLVGVRVHDSHVAASHELWVDRGEVVAGPIKGAPRLDLGEALLLPGLINAHDHLQLNGAAELRSGRVFPDATAWSRWLEAELRRRGRPPGLAAPAQVRHWQGALKNILAGVTTVAHHDPLSSLHSDPDFPVRVAPCGWAHSYGFAGRYGPRIAESRRETSPELPWMVHLGEGTNAEARGEFARLVADDCLASNTMLIHGVALDDAEIHMALRAGAGFVWCPGSNMRLLGETLNPKPGADLERLALGTDSRLSGCFDLLEELRAAHATALLEATCLPSLVTVWAARLLRLPQAGGLAPGCWADLIVLSPEADPNTCLLEARRSDWRAVALGGRPRIADPDLLPWFEALAIPWARVRVDDADKIVDRAMLRYAEAWQLEPRAEIVGQ